VLGAWRRVQQHERPSCSLARAKDAKFILGRELRHTIERVSPAAAKPEEVVTQD